MQIAPFTIAVPQAVLDDLRQRLADTHWAAEVEGVGWDYGTNFAYLKDLVGYWQNQFDWRAQEAKLNQFAQFRAEIDGLGIHFIHERGKGANPLPIILTHGWPDSFYRFHKVIPMLTDPARFGGDPADSFDVVVPSVPGFGFSDRPHTRGVNAKRTADLWARLMTEGLGYQRFAAAGGDVGSEVTMHLAHNHADLLVGIHLTDVSYPMSPPEGVEFSEAAQQYLGRLQQWWMAEGGFNMLQSSKPQTLAYGLNDSPAALAAWIVSFGSGQTTNEAVEKPFGSREELLTNITIYWVTETINSSARMYYEGAHDYANPLYPAPRIEVPVGVAHFPGDLIPPREWVEAVMNVQRWTEMPHGGHFAALETPELFVEELRAFFRPLR